MIMLDAVSARSGGFELRNGGFAVPAGPAADVVDLACAAGLRAPAERAVAGAVARSRALGEFGPLPAFAGRRR